MDDWKRTLESYWDNHLHRFSLEEVNSLDIEEEAKSILQELGLPSIKFASAFIFEPTSLLREVEFNTEKYVVLGDNVGDERLGIFVCLKEETSEIFQLHTQYNEAVFFMNSNLKLLLLFLKKYSEFMISTQDLSEDEFVQNKDIFDNLRESFAAMDPRSIASRDHYWTLILAELDGYFI